MSLFAELKRRNVIRMAGLYLVGAWLVVQVAGTLLPVYDAPPWVMKTLVGVLAVGFVPALIFAWVFELTPEGIKRDEEVEPAHSIAPQTARRMNRVTVAVLLLALAYFGFDKFVLAPKHEAAAVAAVERHDAGVSVAKAGKSIAVLPFVNMSADKENEFFADGLSEEILNSLVAIDDLKVIGRTSSFQFKGKNEDLRGIGEALGASYVLEGSVRREGERIRVTAQLIRAADGVHLWSQTYDRTIKDTFAVQIDVAENVSRALDIVLDDRQRARMEAVGERNVDAFIAYQKAVNAFDEAHTGAGIDMAMLEQGFQAFGRAVENDPGFAAAYYQRTDYYAHVLEDSAATPAELEALHSRYQKDLADALRLSHLPSQRASIAVDAALISDDWRVLPARVEALMAGSGCGRTLWISALSAFLDSEKALAFWKRQLDCDPLSHYANSQYSWSLYYSRPPGESLQAAERAQEHGISVDDQLFYSGTLLRLARVDELRKLAATADTQGRRHVAILLAVYDGDPTRARALAKAFLAEPNLSDAARARIMVNAVIGDRAAADAAAAELDANPIGPMLLASVVRFCACGTPFDPDATPRFRARLAEAGYAWPPKGLMKFPTKDQ
jgi:TolB-like protein